MNEQSYEDISTAIGFTVDRVNRVVKVQGRTIPLDLVENRPGVLLALLEAEVSKLCR